MSIYNDVTINYTNNNLNIPEENNQNIESNIERPRRSTRRVRGIFLDCDYDGSITVRSSMREHCRPIRQHRQNNEPIKSWKQLCRESIDDIFDLQDSEPFRAPVDPIFYPNYSHVIDTPMDLTTVKEQLLADVYESPGDFCKDMRLIFTNSKTYNTNKKSRIYSMTVRLSALFEEKMREVMADWKSASKMMRNYKRGQSSRRRRTKSPTLSPNNHLDFRPINKTTSRRVASSSIAVDLNQPSTSSSVNHHPRTSHRMPYYHRATTSYSMKKYGLRHRIKRIRTYKEDNDNDYSVSTTEDQPITSQIIKIFQWEPIIIFVVIENLVIFPFKRMK